MRCARSLGAKAEEMADSRATYVYAITRRLDPERMHGMRGIAGERVRIIAYAGLSAIVGSVDPRRFGTEPPQGSLQDLRSLEALLRAHHQVIHVVSGAAAVVPLRLGTVYRGDEQVRELLADRRAEFETTLSRVTGRTEWGVKVHVDPEVFAAATATREAPAGASPAGTGTQYLRRRRAEQRSRQQTWDRAAALAEEVHAALGSVAVASRRHAPQDARLSGHQGWMVLNGAYLVDDGRYDDLSATVDRFHDPDRGTRLALTGPWAPYSFAEGEGA
jgi:Gas vesicle synthesis protein GvpL/GvpF